MRHQKGCDAKIGLTHGYHQPIVAVTTAIIALFFHAPHREAKTSLTLTRKIAELDILGSLAFLPSIICLLIGLQWGGGRYPWRSYRVVLLLIFAALLFTIFVIIQLWKKDKATVPPRIIKQRSMAAGAWFSFFIGGAYFLLVYYVSILYCFYILISFFALWFCRTEESADHPNSFPYGSSLSKAYLRLRLAS